MDGAEESGLVEAQLLQLLWVLCKCGRKQQLLQRHLRRGQTEDKQVSNLKHCHFKALSSSYSTATIMQK